MKKSLNKVIVTLAAVAALAMGTTAMAAVTTDTVSVENGTAKFAVTSTATTVGEQVTLLMLKSDADITDEDGITADEIAYIDQAAAVEEDGKIAAKFDVAVKLTAEEIADYEAGEVIDFAVMSGNEGGTLSEGEGSIGESAGESIGKLGDVNKDEAINLTDASLIVDVVLLKDTFDAEEAARADVNKDTAANLSDASLIVDHVLLKSTIEGEATLN